MILRSIIIICGRSQNLTLPDYSDHESFSLITRSVVLGQLRASGFVRARGSGDIRDLNTNSENWAVVKAALCAGTYPNLLKVDRAKVEIKTQ